eukprot:CAMPEP_0114553184 /NCGR_PEP_ID=MMETSP0114-20121206/7519_1 /TAXON_ID=31324 /ORGANISM="Goniomonas sp, Strain m" /LENGTH=142 /DNA_ID=CAMNT_0001738103 /DNA_START=16 /DNA_END=444 /DNA_ORIENTATION=+
MVEHLTKEQVEKLDQVFSKLERGRGFIGAREVGCAFRLVGLHMTVAELQDLLNEAGGKLDATEFKHLMTKKYADCDTVEEVDSAFDFFDQDKDGMLSLIDVQKSLGELGTNLRIEEVREMLREADLNDDGKISKLEFTSVIL